MSGLQERELLNHGFTPLALRRRRRNGVYRGSAVNTRQGVFSPRWLPAIAPQDHRVRSVITICNSLGGGIRAAFRLLAFIPGVSA